MGDGWECVDRDGKAYPAQITETSGGTCLVGVYVEELEAGRELAVELRASRRTDARVGSTCVTNLRTAVSL